MKLSELSEASPFGSLLWGVISKLLGEVVYNIPWSSAELGIFMPTAFDQFVAQTNVWRTSTYYCDQYNIFLVGSNSNILRRQYVTMPLNLVWKDTGLSHACDFQWPPEFLDTLRLNGIFYFDVW